MRPRGLLTIANIARLVAAACFITLMVLYGCREDNMPPYDSDSVSDPALTATSEGGGVTTPGTEKPDNPNKSILIELSVDVTDLSPGIPVLVRVDDNAFLESCGPELEGLRIYSSGGSPLAFEVDSYDKASGAAFIWVEPPAGDSRISINNFPLAHTPAPAERLWEDWELVLHMKYNKEGRLTDSSPNGYSVIKSGGSSTGAAEGYIGSAVGFNGSSEYLTVDSSFSPPAGGANANPYTDTGYRKPTDWEYAQGMTTDGTYIYFAGHHDRTGEGSSIHKIRMSDMTEVAVFEKTGPMHGAELAYAPDRGTLFASTGGEGRAAEIWEMNVNDGSVIAKWDFSKTGFGAAAAVAYCGDGEIILFTSVGDGARFALDRIALLSGGAFEVLGSWVYSSGEDPGVPQGLEYRDGYVYLLADAGATVKVDPHYIYKIKIDPSRPRPEILEKYLISIGAETEGLFFSADGRVYFGTNEERIYLLNETYDKLTPYTEPSATDSSFSVLCWAYIESIPNKYPNILGFGAASGNKNAFALHLMESTAGTLRFGITIGGIWTRFDSPAGSLSEGWNSIAATYDGEVMRLYINGKGAGELAASGMLADQHGPFSIGADIEDGKPAYHFDGKIDEVRVTRRVLTENEISMIHRNVAASIQAVS